MSTPFCILQPRLQQKILKRSKKYTLSLSSVQPSIQNKTVPNSPSAAKTDLAPAQFPVSPNGVQYTPDFKIGKSSA